MGAAGQVQPSGTRSGGEGAEGTENAIARAFGCANGFDQEVPGCTFYLGRFYVEIQSLASSNKAI